MITKQLNDLRIQDSASEQHEMREKLSKKLKENPGKSENASQQFYATCLSQRQQTILPDVPRWPP